MTFKQGCLVYPQVAQGDDRRSATLPSSTGEQHGRMGAGQRRLRQFPLLCPRAARRAGLPGKPQIALIDCWPNALPIKFIGAMTGLAVAEC